MSNELLVSFVDEFDDVCRSAQHGHERRRLPNHVAQMSAFVIQRGDQFLTLLRVFYFVRYISIRPDESDGCTRLVLLHNCARSNMVNRSIAEDDTVVEVKWTFACNADSDIRRHLR